MHSVTCVVWVPLGTRTSHESGVKWCAAAAGGGSAKQAKRKKAKSPLEFGSMPASVLLWSEYADKTRREND